MAKFARTLNAVFLILLLSGCASVQMPGYIARMDHPYERKLQGGFEKIVSSTMYVLKKKGWKIAEESDPSMYERDDRYDNNGYQNLVIITEPRKQWHVAYLASVRLNIFIHSSGNNCTLELRMSTRNDTIAQDLLDQVEAEVNR